MPIICPKCGNETDRLYQFPGEEEWQCENCILGGGRLDMVTEYHLRTGWSKQDLKDAGIELLK